MSILFQDIVFGPVKSRRLGVSLGINLLPFDHKYCTFDCIYCECGWAAQKKRHKLPKREAVSRLLESCLADLKEGGPYPDAITFAGNGEPTIHPDFAGIMDDTLALRDKYFPEAKVTVLSNASTLNKTAVIQALKKADNNILKLDAGREETFQTINKPRNRATLASVVKNLKTFNGNLIIQTLFVRGEYEGKIVDNTTDEEFQAWINLVKEINPRYVMIYNIDRPTPGGKLEKLTFEELLGISDKVEAEGIRTQVFG
jgi:wyosine [tRNA(Phe)-imidazoG37] synthetase (radical SAM superfamily)